MRRNERDEAMRELTQRCEVAELALERMRAEIGTGGMSPKLVEAWSEASQLRVLLDEVSDRHRAERSEMALRVARAEDTAAELRADAARLLQELASTREELEDARRRASGARFQAAPAAEAREQAWSPGEQELLAQVHRAIAGRPAAAQVVR